MAGKERYILPLGASSSGNSPGQGRLQNRRVLVVGAGQRSLPGTEDTVGNGRAISLVAAREGASVAAADMNAASAGETAEMITREGGTAYALTCDVTQADAVERMVSDAAKRLGGLDGVVYNVGIGGAPGLQQAPDEWERIVSANLTGAMLTARAALPLMNEAGSLVFISSVAGLRPGSRIPAYDASKAALTGLMRHTGLEGASQGIRVNIVAPGLIDTPLGRLASQGRPSRSRTPVPFGRQGTGWEVAYAVLFFLSDESRYVTGQTLTVDGGLTSIG